MTRMVDVAAVDDLADGEMRAVAAGDDEFLVVRVGDEFYATQAYCPHMGGQLAKGRLDGTVVTCPRHGRTPGALPV